MKYYIAHSTNQVDRYYDNLVFLLLTCSSVIVSLQSLICEFHLLESI